MVSYRPPRDDQARFAVRLITHLLANGPALAPPVRPVARLGELEGLPPVVLEPLLQPLGLAVAARLRSEAQVVARGAVLEGCE